MKLANKPEAPGADKTEGIKNDRHPFNKTLGEIMESFWWPRK